MAQRPLALGLHVCEKVVVEAETRNLTFVNCFAQRDVKSIPSEPLSFLVCSTLVGGRGRMRLEVRIERLADFEAIFERTGVITFRDPRQEIRLRVPMEGVSFPTEGGYQILILVGNEMVASRKIEIALVQ